MTTTSKQFSNDPVNPDLLKALETFQRQPSDSSRERMHTALCESFLLIPTANMQLDVAKDQWVNIQKDTNFRVATVPHPDGPALPAFTDKAALLKWKGERTTYVAMHAGVILGMAMKNNMAAITLNPGNPTVTVIARAEMEKLYPIAKEKIATSTPQRPAGPTATIKIERPTELPGGFVDQLRQALAPSTQIAEAYLFRATLPNQAPRNVFGVALKQSLPREQVEPIVREVAKQLQPVIAAGDKIELIVLAGQQLTIVRKTGIELFKAG